MELKQIEAILKHCYAERTKLDFRIRNLEALKRRYTIHLVEDPVEQARNLG